LNLETLAKTCFERDKEYGCLDPEVTWDEVKKDYLIEAKIIQDYQDYQDYQKYLRTEKGKNG